MFHFKKATISLNFPLPYLTQMQFQSKSSDVPSSPFVTFTPHTPPHLPITPPIPHHPPHHPITPPHWNTGTLSPHIVVLVKPDTELANPVRKLVKPDAKLAKPVRKCVRPDTELVKPVRKLVRPVKNSSEQSRTRQTSQATIKMVSISN